MNTALGMLELSSIGKGIETADIMIKASNINIMFSKHICMGKFLILISGDVEAVKESIQVGTDNGGRYIVDSFIIPSIHEDILKALKGIYEHEKVDALGTMEFTTVSSGIIALDTALKEAVIKLRKLIIGNSIGGKCYFIVMGDVSSVYKALEAAKRSVENKRIISKIIIPSPEEELIKELI
jgi:PduT-like ethanolamine utilization protein